MKTDTTKGNMTSPYQHDPAKRKHIKKLALGTGAVATGLSMLPDTWIKPVINSVILPSHAQTTESPEPEPLASCSISGPAQITYQSGSTLQQDILYTITNTGQVGLSVSNFPANFKLSAAYGGDASGVSPVNANSPPAVLNPGESHDVFIPALTKPDNCNNGLNSIPYTAGTLTINAEFDQTSCEFVSMVTCVVFGGI